MVDGVESGVKRGDPDITSLGVEGSWVELDARPDSADGLVDGGVALKPVGVELCPELPRLCCVSATLSLKFKSTYPGHHCSQISYGNRIRD
jgi:hypothetical protein